MIIDPDDIFEETEKLFEPKEEIGNKTLHYYDVFYTFKDEYWAIKSIPAVFSTELDVVLKFKLHYLVSVRSRNLITGFGYGVSLLRAELKKDGKLP